jgi:hypothetical protein
MGTKMRKLLAVVASSAVTGLLLFGQTLLDPCGGFAPCPNPVFNIQTIIGGFVVLSWLTIFPATLLAFRAMPRFLAPVAVTLLATGLMALSDTPTIDSSGLLVSFVNVAKQLFLPWLAGSVVTIWLWPNNSFKPMPLRGTA